MLILRIGTDIKKRVDSDKSIPRTTNNLSGDDLVGIPQFLAADIFGDKKVVRLEDWQDAENREVVYKYLTDIEKSENVFIIDELSVLAPTATKLSKYAKNFFDCREKEIDHNAFELAKYIVSRDKKNAWLELMRLKNLKVNAVEVQSVLAWKAKSVGNRDMMYQMLMARHREFNSEGNMYDEMERYILKL